MVKNAARKIAVSRFSKDEKILDVVNEVLLDGYLEKSRHRRHVDAMSWLCKVLKASRLQKYKKTLQTVAKRAPSRKLKKYAR